VPQHNDVIFLSPWCISTLPTHNYLQLLLIPILSLCFTIPLYHYTAELLQMVTPYYFAYEDLLDDWNGATAVSDSSGTSVTTNGGKGSKKDSGGSGNSVLDDSRFSVTDLVVKKTAKGLKNTFLSNGQPKVRICVCASVCACRVCVY